MVDVPHSLLFHKISEVDLCQTADATQDKRALIDLPTLKKSLSGFLNNYVGFVKGKDTLRPCCTHLEASARSKVTRNKSIGRGPYKSIWCV